MASVKTKWLPPALLELPGVIDIVPKLLLRSGSPCPCGAVGGSRAEAERGGAFDGRAGPSFQLGLKLGAVPSLPVLRLRGGGGYFWPVKEIK